MLTFHLQCYQQKNQCSTKHKKHLLDRRSCFLRSGVVFSTQNSFVLLSSDDVILSENNSDQFADIVRLDISISRQKQGKKLNILKLKNLASLLTKIMRLSDRNISQRINRLRDCFWNGCNSVTIYQMIHLYL